uniref:Uncharacterized protein n=1 Tax=Timema cristinae TaxID=61476 RepID=A0A7R9DMS0_TIMCR|nr:unnamed protein product [Timema cristinae]
MNTSFTGQYCIARYYKLQEVNTSVRIYLQPAIEDIFRFEKRNGCTHLYVKTNFLVSLVVSRKAKVSELLQKHFFISLIVFVALLVVASTSYDIYRPSGKSR